MVIGAIDTAFDEMTSLWQDKCVITEVQDCSSLILGTESIHSKPLSIKGRDKTGVKTPAESRTTLNCVRKQYNCVLDSTGLICISQGALITLDGPTGRILKGKVPIMEPAIDRDFTTLLKWTKQYRRMDVLASCNAVDEVRDAVTFGADGIGMLCIEHL